MKYSTYIMTCVASISMLIAGTASAQAEHAGIVIENSYGPNLEVVISGQTAAENNKTLLLGSIGSVTPLQRLKGNYTIDAMEKGKPDTKSLFNCEPISGSLMCVGQNTNQKLIVYVVDANHIKIISNEGLKK